MPFITKHKDGSIEVRRLERQIRCSDGTIQTMVSFDGTTWRLQAYEDKEALRLKRSSNLLGKKWVKAKTQAFDAMNNKGTGYKAPVILPVERGGSPVLGKDVGKKHKYRKDLKAKPFQDVRIPRKKGLHKHRCHGHWFLCACSTPWKKHPCGGDECMYQKMNHLFS